MNQPVCANTLNDRITAIDALDLDPVKLKLMDEEDGHGWSREHADRIEAEYKRYLILLVKYPEATISPTRDIDKFWHGHILDTLKYATDCQVIFGKFLHHFPYFGLRGPADRAEAESAFETMSILYAREFGVPLRKTAVWSVRASQASPDAAWCVKAESGARDPAWCVRAPAAMTSAAWCVNAELPATGGAWCVRVDPSKSAAWCVKADAPAANGAWCVQAIKADASAWCVKAAEDPQKSAWCVRVSGQAMPPNTVDRPGLPAMA